MRRNLITLASIAVVATALVVFAAGPPESVTIDAAMAKKSAVTFPHAKHIAVGPCATCHHTQEGLTAENAADVKKCSTCHLDPEQAETPSMREMNTSKNPFHKLCVGCHKSTTEGKTGPTKCNDCHPKE